MLTPALAERRMAPSFERQTARAPRARPGPTRTATPTARRSAPSVTDRQAASSPDYLADGQTALASYDEIIWGADEQRPPARDAGETADLPAQSPREQLTGQQTGAAPVPETETPTDTEETPDETDEEEAETEAEAPADEAEEEDSAEEGAGREAKGEGEEEQKAEDAAAGAGAVAGVGSASRGGGDAEPARAFQPAPVPFPDTSPVALERRTLDLGSTEAPLVMPRYLRIEPKEGKAGVPPPLQAYGRTFQDSVAAAETLHEGFLSDARRAASELASLYRNIETQAQRNLDGALTGLADSLADARSNLEQAEEDAIARLAMQADDARRRIRAAAGSALATVAARKRVIEGRMSLAQDAATDVESQLVFFVNEVDRAGPPASDAFAALSTDPAPARVPNAIVPYKKHSPEMQTAENEPLDPVVQDRAGERTTSFAQAQAVFATQLTDAAIQFQTAADNAFQPFQQYVDLLGTPARSRIATLRQNATGHVNKIERQSASSVRQSRNQVEVALVERYRRSREQLVGTAERAARSQHGGIERAGEAQLRGYRAAASAQGGVIVALEEEIGRQRERTPEDFAGFVDEASRRTTERAGEIGGSRRDSMGNAARQMRQLSSVRAAAGTSSQERMARQLIDQLTESARKSGAAMMTQIRALEASLRRMAEPVAASIDQFPIPAAAELDTMEGELWQKLDQARAQAQAAFHGGSPPPSEEQTEDPETPKPPAGTGTHPNEFVDRSDKYAAKPATEDLIVALTRAIAPKVIENVESRGRGLIDQMDELEQDPPVTLALLRGLTYLRGQAVIRYYNDERPGKNLLDDLGYYMNVGNPASGIDTRLLSIDAAYKYLYGRRAEGALSEIQAAVEFQNNADQVRDAMTALSPADLEALRGLPGASEIIDSVEVDLGETEGHMFNLLWTATEENARERVAAARAVQLEVKIEEALDIDPERGADDAFDRMEEAAKAAGTTRLEGENEFGLTADGQFESAEAADARRKEAWQDTVSRLGRQGVRWETGSAGGIAWLSELASRHRVYQQGRRLYAGQTRTEQVRLLTNLAEFGAGAPQTRGAQMAVEETRKGGADPERFERALFDPELNPDMDDPDREPPKPGDPPSDFERRLARAREREEQALRFYDEYRNGPREGPPRPVSEIRAELGRRVRAGQSDERQGRLMEMQAVRGLYDPETAALAFEHAVDRWGTDEDLLSRTFSRMSRDQIDTAVGIYDANHVTPLYDRLGIFEHADTYFRELSGDDRIRLQVQAMGNPRNPRERFEVSRMTSRLQLNNAGWAGQFLAGERYRRLDQSHRRLLDLTGLEDEDFDVRGRLRVRGPNGERIPVGNFNEKGEFEPKGENGALEFTLLMAANEHNAAAYQRATDNIANAITTSLVVAAAVISTIATGGAAASIWIPVLVTAGAGLVGMAASWAIKGGRYGYEDAGRDLGMTIVQAATAGIGASLTIARAGGSAALRTALTSRMVSNVGFRSLNIVEEAMIAGASGAVGGGGAALFDDRSWDRGQWLTNIGHGMQRGFLGGFAGGLVTGASTRAIAGAARGMGQASGALTAAARGRTAEVGARLGRLRGAAFARSFPTTLAGRTIGGGLGGGVTRWSEIEYDRRRGVYKGSRAQAWEEIANAATQNSIQSFLEGIGERASDDSPAMRAWRDSIMAGQRPPADLPPAVRPPPELDAAVGRLPPEVADAQARAVAPRTADDRAVPPILVGDGDAEARAAASRAAPALEEGAGVAPVERRPPDEADATARGAARLDEDEPEMLRSAIGPHDEEPQLRSPSDEKTNPNISIPAPITGFPNGIDLKPGMLQTMPGIAADTIVRPVNPTDGAQARQNYDLLRTFNPGVEALLAYNPSNGQYTARTGFPGRVRPMPPPWVTLRHSHGKLVTADLFHQLCAVLPSGIGGDVQVLRSELERFPVRDIHQEIGRESAIDIEINGVHVQTTFEITRKGDNYSISVTIDPPVNGISKLGPYTGDRDSVLRTYAEKARDATSFGSDFGLSKDPSAPALMSPGADGTRRAAQGEQAGAAPDPARRVGGEQASLADTLNQTNREDIAAIARRMETQIDGDPVFATSSKNEQARYEALQQVRTPADVQEAVVRMGLVDRPDAMIRLQAILSDQSLTRPAREQIARAVLDATRESMRRSGALAEGDDLVMFFHGAPGTQVGSYQQGGIDMGRALPKAGEHDLGPGTYVSRDFQSALLYVEAGGRVLPSIIPRSRLGNVIDIAPGSPMRARWEVFVAERGGSVRGAKLEYSPEALKAFQDAIQRRDFGFRPRFDQVKVVDGRGQLVEAFLAHLAGDANLPESVRAAARSPDIILTDLGGGATSGNTRGFVTDQATIRSQRLADIIAEQLGFPRLGPAPDLEMAQYEGPQGKTDKDNALAALPKPVADELAEARPTGPNQQLFDRVVFLVAGRIESESLRWQKDATLLLAEDPLNAFAVLTATDDASRRIALGRFREGLVARYGGEIAERRMRILDYVAAKGGDAFRIEYEHAQRLAAVGQQLDGLPDQLRTWATESPVLLTFALKNRARLEHLYGRYIARNSGDALASLAFERHVLTKRRKGEDAFFDELRALRADRPGEERAQASLVMGNVRRTSTFRQPLAREPLSDTGDQPRRPIEKPEELVPGLRVEHPQFGRGVVDKVENGVALVHFDSDPPAIQRPIPFVNDELSRAGDPDPRFGDPPPYRKPTEVKQQTDAILDFRRRAALPEFGQELWRGTVARIEIAGEVFHGTSADLDSPNYSLSRDRRIELFNRLKNEFGLKVPGDVHENAMFLGHAEAEAMLLAYDHFGRLPEVLEVYADRSTCTDCRNNAVLLARLLGVRELRIYYINQSKPPFVRR